MLSLMDLPEEAWQQVAGCLPAADVLNLLSTCRMLHIHMGRCPLFWKSLLGRHGNSLLGDQRLQQVPDVVAPWHELKESFLIQEQLHDLDRVKWMPLRDSYATPAGREGHNACLIGDNMVLTGGFISDTSIYVKGKDDSEDWQRIVPGGDRPDWVYGASLTTLDDMRAIRYGGFRGGGYSGESNQVALLTLHHGGSHNTTLRATWQVMNCKGAAWESPVAPRAYHSATVIFQRFVVFLGGMKSNRSIFDPLILDTHTWTFYDTTTWMMRTDPLPSSRHGHSTIYDAARHRLVLFGGGSGSDLLRSGMDNSEVWECSLGSWSGEPLELFVQSAAASACYWRRIHEDQNNPHSETSTRDTATRDIQHGPNSLSPSETLNLGRCHLAFLVSPDRVLLVGGSGRPSTNGLLAYDLAKDQFHRPLKVLGPLPIPRFTFAAVLLPQDGYLYIHGGYSSLVSDTIVDSFVLDLVPALNRELRLFPIRAHVRSSASVTDNQVLLERQPYDQRVGYSGFGHAIFHVLAAGELNEERLRIVLERARSTRQTATASAAEGGGGGGGRSVLQRLSRFAGLRRRPVVDSDHDTTSHRAYHDSSDDDDDDDEE